MEEVLHPGDTLYGLSKTKVGLLMEDRNQVLVLFLLTTQNLSSDGPEFSGGEWYRSPRGTTG